MCVDLVVCPTRSLRLLPSSLNSDFKFIVTLSDRTRIVQVVALRWPCRTCPVDKPQAASMVEEPDGTRDGGSPSHGGALAGGHGGSSSDSGPASGGGGAGGVLGALSVLTGGAVPPPQAGVRHWQAAYCPTSAAPGLRFQVVPCSSLSQSDLKTQLFFVREACTLALFVSQHQFPCLP